ncbi:hypothetical protein OB955_04580 [Halobacteria archaeon AArc-m2/3/4]|uniref:Uncharacterized protein n=1 Tax=Natronoglomus mannanivorans TaxID=2979990 RepID=A0ABT2QAP5_9EURY|nr:hypothetical protein [Halobacteria archaeon AArc-m2/3/4]
MPPIRTPSFTRRELLTAVGSATALSATNVAGSSETSVQEATLHVRVYPGPVSVFTWLRNGWSHFVSGWFDVHRDAMAAVETALERIATYAEANSSLDHVETSVEACDPVDFSLVTPDSFSLFSQEALLDAFHEEVHDRQVNMGSTCHLLLWWNALNYDLGYGGTRAPNTHVGALEGEDSQTIANLGATEAWDSRAVTRNIAIHETLHTFLSPDVVEEVVDSRCDHNLGTAVRVDEDTLEVSPMATAYAGPDEYGGGTRWHGTGCYDHDSFAHHDGYEDAENWEYTTELSDATLEATTLYIERYLA